MNSNIRKQAQRDATEYAKAYMSYGEGAGTRRKLIEGTVEYKMSTVPGYREAFEKSSEHQDMAAHAKNAKRAARRRDVNGAVVRNTKAVVTGRHENLSTGILVFGAAVVLLNQTGYDKKLIDFSKKKARELKYRVHRMRNKNAPVYNIYNNESSI